MFSCDYALFPELHFVMDNRHAAWKHTKVMQKCAHKQLCLSTLIVVLPCTEGFGRIYSSYLSHRDIMDAVDAPNSDGNLFDDLQAR